MYFLLSYHILGYQGWGASPQQQPYNYNNAPGSYQGWGAPPGPQGPPPPQWSSYGGPQQTQSYGAYDMYSNTNTGGPSGKFCFYLGRYNVEFFRTLVNACRIKLIVTGSILCSLVIAEEINGVDRG